LVNSAQDKTALVKMAQVENSFMWYHCDDKNRLQLTWDASEIF
jgi:hypothetical protein